MEPTKLRALQAQIHATQACAGLIHTNDDAKVDAHADDTQIAAILNGVTAQAKVSLRVDQVFDVLFASGDWLRIRLAQTGDDLAKAKVATVAYTMINDADRFGSGTVNVDMETTEELFNQLQEVGLLDAGSRSQLEALATCATPVFGETVTGADVSLALRGPWGDE